VLTAVRRVLSYALNLLAQSSGMFLGKICLAAVSALSPEITCVCRRLLVRVAGFLHFGVAITLGVPDTKLLVSRPAGRIRMAMRASDFYTNSMDVLVA
jgi:hypothetical protein